MLYHGLNVFAAYNECRDIFLWKCFEEILENRNNLFVNVLRKFINGHGVLWGRHWDARSYIYIYGNFIGQFHEYIGVCWENDLRKLIKQVCYFSFRY